MDQCPRMAAGAASARGMVAAEGEAPAHPIPPGQQRLAILETRDALRALLLRIEASTSSLEDFKKDVSSQLRDTDAVMRMAARIQQMGKMGGQPHAIAANALSQSDGGAMVAAVGSATGHHHQIMEYLDAISNFGLANFLTVRDRAALPSSASVLSPHIRDPGCIR